VHIAIIVTAVLGYIGFAFFVLAINRVIGWRALFTDVQNARAIQGTREFEQEYGAVKVLTYFGWVSLLLWTIALRERMFFGKWRLLAPIGFLVLLPYFFLGERVSLLTATTWIAAVHLIWRPIHSPRRVAVVGAAAAVSALGFFYWVGYHKGATIHNHPEIRSHLTTRKAEDLAFPYMYLTANTPVLSKTMQDPVAPRTYGALTFWPAAKLSNVVLRRTDYPPKYGAFYNIPFDAYNSASWLGPFYLDFGFIGCIVMPGLFGVATTWLVLRAKQRRTFLAAWVAALGLTVIVFSPLKNAFADASTWVLLLAAPFVCYFVTQRLPQEAPEEGPRVAWKVRKRPWLAAVGVGLGTVVVFTAIAVRLAVTPARALTSTPALSKELVSAGEKVAQIYNDEGAQSSPHSLATRLEVSDPSVHYEGIYPGEQLPSPNAIGVATGGREFRLRARSSEGNVLEVIGVRRAGKYRLASLRILGGGLVANGGFEDPLGPPWVVASRAGIKVTTIASALDGAYSLRLQYKRETSTKPTSVSQLVRDLPNRSPGTRFTLREVILTKKLSRQVVYGLQLIYRDGTSRYISGTTRPPAQRGSNLIGSSGGSIGPQTVTLSGIASKPISSVRVFAVDAGSEPVTGAITLDDVRLSSRKLSRER
jgi:oligosaccharide repeat unit polymerase